jgi:hypothetical protein
MIKATIVTIISFIALTSCQNKTNLRIYDFLNDTNNDVNVTLYVDSITYNPSTYNSTLIHTSESTEQVLYFVFSFFGVLIFMFIYFACNK